jgi:uncharacterized protein YciI
MRGSLDDVEGRSGRGGGVKYVLTYRAVADFLPLARSNREAHVARMQAFAERGQLLMAGPMDEPMNGDALSVFTTREAAVHFAEGDPFVVHGVVDTWDVRPWREIIAPDDGSEAAV